MQRTCFFFCFISCLFMFAAVVPDKAAAQESLLISSPVFENNGMIPAKYTCDGKNINPGILIRNEPAATKSFALIVDDPDAPVGTWVHWVVWNLPPGTGEIREGALPSGAKQGMNDFRKHAYGGPCPPSGTHRYFFKLYALDSLLNLAPDATKKDLERALHGHVLGHAEVIGLYKRK